MDSSSGVLSRNMGTISGNSRSRDYAGGIALNGNDSDRAAHSSPWGNSIWNSSNGPSIGFGFGSAKRDSSRPRDASNFDLAEGKTGSGSLVADSETEWRPSRPSWVDNGPTNIPHARSSGVSPARKRSIVATQSSQQFGDSSPSSFFPMARNSAVGSGPVAKPSKPLLDPTSTNFTSSRQVESLNTGFANFGFGENSQNTGSGAWPDNASVHSPNDDRRSVSNSEYFAPSSGAPSRNGSLPPSRHGGEPSQYNQSFEAYSRLPQAAPRQASSFSHAHVRAFQERSGSIQSESFYTLNRLPTEQDQDARLAHRASLSINGFQPGTSGSGLEGMVTRDSFSDAQLPLRTDEASSRNGTYTPDSVSAQGSDPNAQFRAFQFDSRSAPNGSGVRQSPFYSNIHTPPVFDRLNPYSSEQTLSHPNNLALVQNKLAGYQYQQERRNFVPQNQFSQQQFQHLLPATQLRNPYYQFIPNGVTISALPPHMAMAAMTPMMPVSQPPRGPRDQQLGDGQAILGLKLAEFKRESKTNKRWELTDIYNDVVEFAGDQHGSRFIQQKLETANS